MKQQLIPTDPRIGPLQEEWLQTLEQHPERQQMCSLGSGTIDHYKCCVLGLFGLLSGSCVFENGRLYDAGGEEFHKIPDNLFTSLSLSWKKLGLYGAMGNTKLGVTGETLAFYNDSGKTFPEIAAIIRANPDHYLKFPV